MKKIVFFCLLFLPVSSLWAQKYFSDKGKVTFFSEAPMENIEAHTAQGKSMFDLATGEVVFSIPVQSFEFEKELMKEHFNENYMETHQYPKSTFKGKVTGYEPENGTYEVVARGELLIHGVTQEVSIPGRLMISSDGLEVEADFVAALKDYKIKVPKVVFYNIAEEIDVKVNFKYSVYEQ